MTIKVDFLFEVATALLIAAFWALVNDVGPSSNGSRSPQKGIPMSTGPASAAVAIGLATSPASVITKLVIRIVASLEILYILYIDHFQLS